jgi:putative IMPACT (imprinted ancient) family translation regulator
MELDRINTREELIQLLKVIISYFDPALLGRESDVKAAFQGAASSITNKALNPGAKKPTAEIQRMQELAGLK